MCDFFLAGCSSDRDLLVWNRQHVLFGCSLPFVLCEIKELSVALWRLDLCEGKLC